MSNDGSPGARGYVVPRYRAEDAAFHHFLHGTVPGHLIDFMYCPEVPQGALRQTHFGHLARLIKYIEPRDGAEYAFAVGNLSRDDVQHGPGHGGLAVIFALRVPGVVDHAGRDMPPYAHGVVAVDRELTYTTLLETVTALHRHFLEREGAEGRRGDFYRSYVRTMREAPGEAAEFLAKAIDGFEGLPSPPRSTLGWDYVVGEEHCPEEIALVYDEPMEIGTVMHWASALAALLYRSNVKWTSISIGGEIDIPGGVAIRFVPRGDVRAGTRERAFELDELPEDEDSLAALLFGAKRRGAPPPERAKGWREVLLGQGAEAVPEEDADVPVDVCDGESAEGMGAKDIDDAAATIPVAALIGGVSAVPSCAVVSAAGKGASTPARKVTVPEDACGESEAEWPRRKGPWVPIVGAVAAVGVVIAMTVGAGMSLRTSPPAETSEGEAQPSSGGAPAAGEPTAHSGSPDAGHRTKDAEAGTDEGPRMSRLPGAPRTPWPKRKKGPGAKPPPTRTPAASDPPVPEPAKF